MVDGRVATCVNYRLVFLADVNNGWNCVRTTRSSRSSRTTVLVRCPKVLGYVRNTSSGRTTCCGRPKKSEYPTAGHVPRAHSLPQSRWPIYSAIVNVVVVVVVVVSRVLHKGSIPMGQLISPKTTHTNNMATWSDMSMSGRLLPVRWFSVVLY